MSPEPASLSGWVHVASRHAIGRVLVVCRDAQVRPSASDGAIEVVHTSAHPVDQQSTPFPMTYLESCLSSAAPEVQRAAIHQALQHLDRGGVLSMGRDLDAAFAETIAELGMTALNEWSSDDVVVYRRSARTTVHDLLWDARAMITRVTADALAGELDGPDAPLVVDTRTHTDRCRSGVIGGSIHVPRTVVEWHLDPANGYRHPDVRELDQRLVIVCNGGYSSSLAAANLVKLGFTDVRDLVGGVKAWIHAGHPVVAPDHAHLDL